MSVKDYREAMVLIEQMQDIGDFVGECSEELIEKAEAALNVEFPKLYRDFLLNYGAGNFGSEEIYGVIKGDFENSGIPDAIWFTLKQRQESKLPLSLVIIYHTGGEEMYCLDLSRGDQFNEPPVVSYHIGVEPEGQPYDVVASDFGEFLLQRFRAELGNL